MKIKQITENTTSGSIATVDTALGGTQRRGNPSIYGGKKVGSLFKGKKTKSQYANSVNESAELSEAQLEEEDVIVVPGQGRSRKNGFVPHGKSRLDHEVEMARSDLFSAAKNAQQVYLMIKDVGEDEGLDGWVQEKIIKANDYLNTIREYLEGKQVQGVTEGTDNVDSLVTDTETVMEKFKMDATQELTTQALKIVLGEREYKDRPGYYYSFIRQIIARSKQQGLTESEDDIRPQGRILKRLRDIAIMSPTLTFQNFRQSGKEAIITDAIMACKILKHHYLQIQNKNQPMAQFIYNLENEIDDFRRGRKLDTPDGNEYTMDLSDLSRRTLGKMQFHTKEDVTEGAKVDRMVKHIEKSEEKSGKSKDEAENIAWATANKRGMLDNKNKKA